MFPVPEALIAEPPTEPGPIAGRAKNVDCPPTSDPLEFLLAVMNDNRQSANLRARCAIAACAYTHTKKGESGKKESKQEAAERATTVSKFAPSAPPKLSVVK